MRKISNINNTSAHCSKSCRHTTSVISKPFDRGDCNSMVVYSICVYSYHVLCNGVFLFTKSFERGKYLRMNHSLRMDECGRLGSTVSVFFSTLKKKKKVAPQSVYIYIRDRDYYCRNHPNKKPHYSSAVTLREVERHPTAFWFKLFFFSFLILLSGKCLKT